MNKSTEKYLRGEIKTKLKDCTFAHQCIFKRMYSPTNLDAEINDVVDNMPVDRLDWSLTQIENTLGNNND